MKISIEYKSTSDNKLRFNIKEKEYLLFSDDKISIDIDENLQYIDFEVLFAKSRSLLYFLIGLPLKIICGFFNILTMNVYSNWAQKIEPFTLSCRYQLFLKENTLSVNYQPSQYFERENKLKRPILLINNQNILCDTKYNRNNIKICFQNYCYQIISIWFYPVLFFGIILFSSINTFKLWLILLIMLIISIIIPTIVLIKEYNHMIKITQNIENKIKNSDL